VNAQASCTANAKAQCTGNCSAHGVVVCDGVVQQLIDDAKAAADWVAAHVTYSASASASCSGNTCTAQAQAEAKSSCAAAPGGTQNGEAGLLAIAAAFAATAVRKLRRRSS
jgi:MYXO-CTERM domain-containing protein